MFHFFYVEFFGFQNHQARYEVIRFLLFQPSSSHVMFLPQWKISLHRNIFFKKNTLWGGHFYCINSTKRKWSFSFERSLSGFTPLSSTHVPCAWQTCTAATATACTTAHTQRMLLWLVVVVQLWQRMLWRPENHRWCSALFKAVQQKNILPEAQSCTEVGFFCQTVLWHTHVQHLSTTTSLCSISAKCSNSFRWL